jgi:Ca2+-binding RTX toxin-like protein
MWQVERLEGRRLMSTVVVVGTSFDPVAGPGTGFSPIVGPVGETPGTIGRPGDGPWTGDQSGYLPPYWNPFYPGTPGGGGWVGGSVGGSGGTIIIGGSGSSASWNANNFYRRGFPVLFGDGGVMRVRHGQLNVTGTNADDTILISRVENAFGTVFGMDVTINGETRRLDGSVFTRFVRAINVDAGRGDDVVAGEEDLNVAMKVIGGRGDDSIAGGSRNDTLFGGVGDDYLVGGDGRDWLNGENGNDTLEGGDGNDRMIGGNNDDVFLNGDDDGEDYVDGGQGKDTADDDEADLIVRVEAM